MTHELKTWAPYWELVWCGSKRFEIRKDDRGFKVGDHLVLREWSAADGYTTRELTVTVCHIVRGGNPAEPVEGLAEGWVVMSIARNREPL